MYNVLFLDIDGTILKPDQTYSETTKKAIAAVKAQGVDVFLATGRPLHEIHDLAEALDIHSFIAYNGAFALHQGNVIVNEPIPQEQIKQFTNTAAKNGQELILYARDTNYMTDPKSPFIKQFADLFDMKSNALYTSDAADKILGATVLNAAPEDVPMYEIDANFRLSPVHVNGAENSYDILRKNVNKGYAVEQTLKHLNISRDQAIAFGDGMNDKEMLTAVGTGVAMANAHEDLFPYAEQQTTSVTDDGIAHGLQQLGLL
ncbi:Cof-type HAD-IIB family hydrolase [Barrientosiimonas marina]|uniref:HAD family hydrolase n=1 Tax=Lentibacillus kimchii TaxID=1542911 RepID=A0ABW2UYT3_9BACI